MADMTDEFLCVLRISYIVKRIYESRTILIHIIFLQDADYTRRFA